MSTTMIQATYKGGLVRPSKKLPFREGAVLKLTIRIPTNPVLRTRGIIRVDPRTAREIIYGEEYDLFGT